MALRSPSNEHNYWGSYANPGALPGVASAEVNLEAGDQAYSISDASTYVCTSAAFPATWTLSAGITELTGDVIAGPGTGSEIATVTGLQGNPVSSTVPNAGDVLVWDGTEWVPTSMNNLTAANFDAFGRLRTSDPQTVFDAKMVYDTQPLYFSDEKSAGAPATTHSITNAAVTLSVNAANQYSIRQSRRYFNYQPGKSQLIFQTFNLNGLTTNAYKRAGYFDDTNGILFELDGVGTLSPATGTGPYVEVRSGSSTATARVHQSQWNIDKLDGTGTSGINLLWDKTQILIIDFEWLGVGSVRIGFVVDGQIVYAHRFDNANVNGYVYMSTPNLPVRWEIRSAAGFSGLAGIDCICASVNSEGGLQAMGTQYSYVRPTLTGNIAGGDTVTLLSIRHTAAYPRVTIVPINVSPCSDTNGVSSWELVYNPTLAGATWGATNGYLDIDTEGTATGGTVLEAGTFTNSVGAQNLNLRDTTLTLGNPVVVNNLGTPSTNFDVISLRVKNLSTGNQTYIASLAWVAVT